MTRLELAVLAVPVLFMAGGLAYGFYLRKRPMPPARTKGGPEHSLTHADLARALETVNRRVDDAMEAAKAARQAAELAAAAANRTRVAG